MRYTKLSLKLLFNYILVLFILLLPYQALAEEKTEKSTPPAQVKEAKNPEIQFQEDFFDFGKIEQQKSVSHIFKFKNTGNADLVINDLKSTCGCTAALVTLKVIPPGETGEIKVTFSSKNFQGEVKRSVFVSSNDPKNSKVILNIKSFVQAFLEVKPKFINFGSLKKGEAISRSLTVKNLTNAPVTIKEVKSEVKDLKIGDFEKEINPEEETIINLTLNPTTLLQDLLGNIEITANQHPDEKLIIPVSGRIIGDIILMPENIYFGMLKKSEKSEQKIKITNNSDKTLKLLEVKSSLEFIKPGFNGDAILPKKSLELTLSTLPAAPAGPFRGKIEIKTDNKDQPLLSAMLSGAVKE